ncbi:MAG TPA: PhaM family polyhydroxyalkanoate granule multifunctional regulatory protein [Burkholderiaceae bacterium]|nr:PhaM family polyhydroxyalkanoate granule multifunctional regulatory protein [Burkholderiaceae bacterium]
MVNKPAASPFNAMGETLDFMQKMWGNMGMPTPGSLAALTGMPQRMPSMLAPTVDVDELDKRIADLRAVEKWLELNAGMLRTTIQTLEVQRATIATLKGIGGAMLAPIVGASEASPPRVPRPTPTPEFRSVMDTPPAPAAPETAPAQRTRRRKPAEEPAPSLAEDALNPAAWWQALQHQFAHIAAGAGENKAEEKTKPVGSRRRKPR